MESCVWPDHVYRNRADCQVNITRPPCRTALRPKLPKTKR
jgi:hypothetical protein